jgi:hypothetical protein
MLEWAVVYDLQAHDLALESLGVSASRLTQTYGTLIKPTQIPMEVLTEASERVNTVREQVNEQRHELSSSPLIPWTDRKIEHAPFVISQAWPYPYENLDTIEVHGERGVYRMASAEKVYFDNCVEKGLTRVIGRSNDDAERALFYAELSDGLSIPVLISDGKQKWLQEINRRIWTDINSVIKKMVDEEAKKVILSRIGESGILSPIDDIQYPPLAEMIVRLAQSKSWSLVDAAKKIRESPEAVAYRNLLAQLYSDARMGRAGQDKLSITLSEIQHSFSDWYERTDKSGTPVKLQLGKIPKIGWLFELIGLGQITINLPFRVPDKPYLSFIFNWYRPQLVTT